MVPKWWLRTLALGGSGPSTDRDVPHVDQPTVVITAHACIPFPPEAATPADRRERRYPLWPSRPNVLRADSRTAGSALGGDAGSVIQVPKRLTHSGSGVARRLRLIAQARNPHDVRADTERERGPARQGRRRDDSSCAWIRGHDPRESA